MSDRISRGWGRVVAPALAVALLLPAAPTLGDEIADFYRDKTVVVTYPTGPGGTFHLYSQLVSRHLPKYIPGNPTAIIQNRPGAGGITMNNYMAHAAPKDGTVLAMPTPGTVTAPLFDEHRFDPREFAWLGSVAVRSYLLALWHDAPADSLDDMRKTEIVLATTGTNTLNYHTPKLMNELLGTRFRLISGYSGAGDSNLAIERGEVHGRANYYGGFTGAKPDWIRENRLKFFFLMGPPIPDLPHLERFVDLVENEEERRMVRLFEGPISLGQAFFLPPGTPAPRVAAMREAFAQMVKDPDYIAEAKKQNLELSPLSADEAEKVIAEIYDTPPELVKRLARLIQPN